jgi:chromosome segregation ATPase
VDWLINIKHLLGGPYSIMAALLLAVAVAIKGLVDFKTAKLANATSVENHSVTALLDEKRILMEGIESFQKTLLTSHDSLRAQINELNNIIQTQQSTIDLQAQRINELEQAYEREKASAQASDQRIEKLKATMKEIAERARKCNIPNTCPLLDSLTQFMASMD